MKTLLNSLRGIYKSISHNARITKNQIIKKINGMHLFKKLKVTKNRNKRVYYPNTQLKTIKLADINGHFIGEIDHVPMDLHSNDLLSIQKKKFKIDYKLVCSYLFIAILGIVALSVIGQLKLSNDNDKLEKEVASLNKQLDTKTTEYNEVVSNLNDLVDITNEVNSENIELAKANDTYYAEVVKYEEREVLFNKYEYAVYYGGERTDITYDQLETAEDLMTDAGMDPNLLLGIIMVESRGDEDAKNAVSTSTGYGQFIKSTGRYVYEDLLGNGSGTYSHYECANNGDTAIEMMAACLTDLRDRNNGNVNAMIRSYRGVNDPSYIPNINSFVTQNGGVRVEDMDLTSN